MKELWKDFPGYEGIYQVSNRSRIRSRKNFKYKKYWRILIPHLRRGYYTLCLKVAGRPVKYMRRGRMIAMAWIPNPENKKEVNHKNGVTTDDRISNLEWVTPSENINHYYYTLRKGTIRSIIQMDMKGDYIKTWPSISEAARAVGGSMGNIVTVCKGKNHYAYGFKWKYA